MKRLKNFLASRAEKRKAKMQDIKYVTKLYKRSQLEFALAFIAFALLLLANYNYIIFKMKMTSEYIYTDTLDEMSREYLNEPMSAQNFDLMTIGLYREKLQDEDKFFQLYKFGEFAGEKKEMDEIGEAAEVYKLENGTGVISFKVFSGGALKTIKKNIDNVKDCDTIIIDLRDNTGGYLDSAVGLAELFLDKGNIIYSRETKHSTKVIKTKKAASLRPQKLIILQNEWTASASELFIMALKENMDNVTTVGTRSFGKGIGQSEYMLMGGYGFKFTSLKLHTPSGGSINGTGIEPDVEYDGEDMLAFAEKNF